MKIGSYVKFRGKQRQDAIFTVVCISGAEALCLNCWGFKFWRPIAGLKYA